MTTPPRKGTPGIEQLRKNSADQIKPPEYVGFNHPGPVAERDINYGFPTNDQDWAQLWTELGPNGVNTLHTRDDVDTHPYAHHHTLGTGRNNASPGDHIHDGKTSNPIGNGMGLSISGAKGSNAALGSLIAMLKQVISFTDNTTA